MAKLSMDPYERFWVLDEINGQQYQWKKINYILIDLQVKQSLTSLICHS